MAAAAAVANPPWRATGEFRLRFPTKPAASRDHLVCLLRAQCSDRRLQRFASCQHSPADRNTTRSVHFQQLHRRLPSWRQTSDLRADELEMFTPRVLAWMKQFDRFTINFSRQIWAFVQVASCEVRQFIATLMLPGNDVLDVKCYFAKIFGQPAILTANFRTLPYEIARFSVNHVATRSEPDLL